MDWNRLCVSFAKAAGVIAGTTIIATAICGLFYGIFLIGEEFGGFGFAGAFLTLFLFLGTVINYYDY